MKNVLKKIALMSMALVLMVTMAACAGDAQVSETNGDAVKNTETEVQAEEAVETADAADAEKVEEKKEEVKKETAAPEKTEAPKAEKPSLEPSKEPVEVEKEEVSAPTAETARKYIGKSVSSLIAAIGQPSGKSYATSCIGDGEDGEWYYPGFTVYTYRDTNGSERVEDVF